MDGLNVRFPIVDVLMNCGVDGAAISHGSKTIPEVTDWPDPGPIPDGPLAEFQYLSFACTTLLVVPLMIPDTFPINAQLVIEGAVFDPLTLMPAADEFDVVT